MGCFYCSFANQYCVDRRKMTPEDTVAMQNEIDIMREVDHPNIVKMLNVYEDKNHYCLVMELMCGGEVN